MAEYIEKCAVWLEDENKEKFLVEAEKCYINEAHYEGRVYCIDQYYIYKINFSSKNKEEGERLTHLKVWVSPTDYFVGRFYKGDNCYIGIDLFDEQERVVRR